MSCGDHTVTEYGEDIFVYKANFKGEDVIIIQQNSFFELSNYSVADRRPVSTARVLKWQGNVSPPQ